MSRTPLYFFNQKKYPRMRRVTTALLIALLAILSPGALHAHATGVCPFNVTPPAIERSSSNDSLANLTLSQGTLSPSFSKSITSYTTSVGNTTGSITVTPLASDSTAAITVNGNVVLSGQVSTSIPLNVGTNTITTTVTAQDGVTMISYTITVTRAASSNADLSSLNSSPGVLSPVFSSSNTSYTAVATLAKKQHTIYTMGDSFTASGEYQNALGPLLGNQFAFVNLGIAGDHTTGMANRFPVVVNAVPDYVIILGGVNDVLDGSRGGAKAIENNLQAMYTLAHNAGVKVIALTIAPSKGFRTWTTNSQAVQDSVNAWIPTALNADYIINTFAALQDPANADQLLPAYDSGDHLHPNQAGQSEIASLIYSGANIVANPIIDQVNIANTSEVITPVTVESTATVTVNGVAVASGSNSAPIPLSLGSNNIATQVTAQDGTIKTYNLNVTGTPSTNATLAYLSLSSGGLTLTPAFATGTFSYTTTVDHDTTSVKVKPTTMDATATVTVNGVAVTSGNYSAPIALTVGVNNITVTVTAQDGSTQNTYTIAITRLPTNLANIALSIGHISPAFSNTVTNYTAVVTYPVASITVTPTASNAGSQITVNGVAVTSGSPSGAVALSVGANTITVVVTDLDGTSTTYTIIDTRPLSTNANLELMKPSTGTLSPQFSSATTSYTSSVAYTVASITITLNTADANATVTVNGNPVALNTASPAITLATGANVITTLVTAPDGVTQKAYTLTVTRAAPPDASLANLTLSQGSLSPSFAKGTTSYTTSVGNATTLITLTPQATDPGATITINGTTVLTGQASPAVPLNVGTNTINTVVTARAGGIMITYTVTVTRLPADLKNLLTSSSVLSPAFSNTITNYTGTVANTVASVTVTPFLGETNTAVTVNGVGVTSGSPSQAIPLVVGVNKINVVVTGQNGSTTYTITETRLPSSNANLEAMKPSSGTVSPAFSSAVTSYTANVATAISSITITPATAEPNATVTVNGIAVAPGAASAPIALAVGTNVIATLVTAQDGVTQKAYTLTVTRASALSDASLAKLQLSNGALSPAFSASTFNYTTGVGFGLTTMTVTPTATMPGATITVNGTQVTSGSPSQFLPLVLGNNTINIVVTAPDGVTTQAYTLTINEGRSVNNFLSGLSISTGVLSPVFVGATTSYTANVNFGVSSITMTPVTADPTATVAVNGVSVISGSPSGAIALSVGPNTINIVVTAQNQTTKTYAATITRASGTSDASLGGITLSNGILSPVFAPGTFNYTTVVGYGLKTMRVTPITDAPNATVTVNGSGVPSGTPSPVLPLVVGPNTCNIVVTSQDGSVTQTYTLIITESRSPNNTLAGLTISNGTLAPAFAAAITNYTVNVPNNVLTTTITPTLADATATMTVNGTAATAGSASSPIALVAGANVISIVVTAQNQATKTYTITVARAQSTNSALSNLTLSQASISPGFSAATTAYSASVANGITSVILSPVAADSTAAITVNGTPVITGTASGAIPLNVGINNIITRVTAQDGVTVTTYTITVTRAPSTNAAFANLVVSQGTLTPAFAPITTSYTESVTNSIASLSITPTPADPTATITVNGAPVSSTVASAAINLNVGQNIIITKITAQDGITANSDTVTVNRAPSSNAALANLVLSAGTLSPSFNIGTSSYNATVPSNTALLMVTPTAADPTAAISVNGAVTTSGAPSTGIALNYGQNTVIVSLLAQDGITTSADTITVVRPLSNNAMLANLSIGQGAISPVFSAGTNNYTANVATAVTAITVTPTLADNTATLTINGISIASGMASPLIALNPGATTVTIQVTAQDGITVNSYTIAVTNTALSNAALATLTISQGILSPVFNTGTNNYTTSLPNSVTSVTLTPTVTDPTATVKVNGLFVTSGGASGVILLNAGLNTITTTVIAQDSVTTDLYTISITRAPSTNADLNNLTLSQGALSPVFSAGTNNYTVSVPNNVTNLTVLPALADSTATVTMNGQALTVGQPSGPIILNVGQNTITTQVTAQDGVSINTFTITVSRAPSSNANLNNLVLSQGTVSPVFAPGTNNYTAVVANTATSITVLPVLADSTATMTVNGIALAPGSASAPISLNVGQDTIITQITAQDGITMNTYTLVITRVLSPDADLANLALSNGALSPAFNPDSVNYTATVNIVKKDHTVYTMGDSITTNGEYQIDLASLLNNQFYFVNAAISGALTSVMVNRFPMVVNAAPDYVIVLGGTDDINHVTGAAAVGIESNLQSMYTAAHNAGSKVIAITLTPDKGNANWNLTRQAQQDSINMWIPTAQNVDYLIDGYHTLVDPANPNQLLPAYDSGDHLHPSKAGQDALAAAIYAGSQFTPNPLVDQANVANSSVTVTPTIRNPNATATVNGTPAPPGPVSATIPISLGTNTINTQVTAQDGTIKNYTVNLTGLPSNNANLAAMTASTNGNSLAPLFDPNVTSYTASVLHDSTVVRIKLSAVDSDATITLNGLTVKNGKAPLLNLALGPNIMNIVVTAADGVTQKAYTLNEFRMYSSNDNLELMKPSVGVISPNFSSGITSYTSSVPSTVTSITITPNTADPTANVTVNGIPTALGVASAPIALAVGQNTINTVVTAQDGVSIKTYTLMVTRASTASDASLSNIQLSNGVLSPAFSATGFNYSTVVGYGLKTMTVTPTTNITGATITVNGVAVASGKASQFLPLVVGPNATTIVVTGQDGVTTQTYNLTITESRSTINNLAGLTISSGALSPNFAVATTNYTANVPFTTTSISVTPTVADPYATVMVNGVAVPSGSPSGAIALSVGPNTISTVVTPQAGVIKIYTTTVTRAAPASNAGLASLSTSKGTLSPVFATGTNSYTAMVTNGTTSLTITPVTVDPTATVTVNSVAVISGKPSGAIALSVGSNAINLTVTAQDGTTTQNYTINVTRPSTNAKLSALNTSIGTLTPVFNSNTNSYTISAGYSTSAVTVTAATAASGATIKVNGTSVASGTPSGALPLNAGGNTITVIVTAQDGITTASYTVTVIRGTPSANAALSGMTLSKGALSPVFAGTTTSYTNVVTNGTTSVTLIPVSADPTAAITVNGVTVISGKASGAIALAVGSNTVNVIVTAQNGTTIKTYTVNIIRPSTNAKLSLLKINSGTLSPAFNTNTGSYTVAVANTVASITVTPTTAVNTATMTVNGTAVLSGSPSQAIPLVVGANAITTLVTAQDGVTTATYTVTITRAPGSNNNVYEPIGVTGPIGQPQLEDGITVHQGISPNGDGINDFLQIDGISSYPDNHLKIMDRNGTLVYETTGYDNATKVFDGHSSKTRQMQLPGTYFYSLEYTVNGITKRKTGFIVVKY